MGDFNQRIPPARVPAQVAASLQSALAGWCVATQGIASPQHELAIDHIVHCDKLKTVTVRARSRFAEDGTALSDHFGVVAELTLA
jgi:endonuclease/exonuclease/phosphatase family metal-dependent hydrolase